VQTATRHQPSASSAVTAILLVNWLFGERRLADQLFRVNRMKRAVEYPLCVLDASPKGGSLGPLLRLVCLVGRVGPLRTPLRELSDCGTAS